MKKSFWMIFVVMLCREGYSQHVVFATDYIGSIMDLGGLSIFNVYDTTYNGNYIMAGGSNNVGGSHYGYGITDQNGNPIWERDSTNIFFEGVYFNSGLRTN